MGSFGTKFDSLKQEWTTPQDLFDKLNKEFNFNFDLAADETNTKCKKFFSKEDNALSKEWHGRCWLNPPYGEKNYRISDWVKKCFEEVYSYERCDIVVILIPARTNTKWWNNYIMKAQEVRFILGRPKFGNAIHGLPQPLALVVFDSRQMNNGTKYSSFKI